ncbi:MAG TPA: radical SAM protein [Candidatus Acidoferrales bacterium]|nr:radical SAM protein [Candidatus Acidoferrales bacterium]
MSSLRGCTEDRNILDTLPVVVVYAHSSCNCRCVMCDIWKTRESKIFEVAALERQVHSIRRLGVRWIVFSGGEPLLNPELPQLCAVLRKEGIRLTLLSTGLLLKKHACDVAIGFDDLIVSLDGPPEIHDRIRRVDRAFVLLQEGVASVKDIRPDVRITARCTVQKGNYRYLLETAGAAKLIGLNGVSFLAVDLTSAAFNRPLTWPVSRKTEIGLSIEELPVLEENIDTLIRCGEQQFGSGFIAESPDKLRRIARHFRVQLGLEPAEAPVCNAPWVSAVIEADGTVRPCFFHRAVGNLRNTTLEAVINNPAAQEFRATLDVPTNDICKKCVCSLNYRA